MIFKYKAIKDNKITVGKIDAVNQKKAIELLNQRGYFLITLEPIEKKNKLITLNIFNNIGFNDIVDITRQLAIMINAGLTILEALEILKKQTPKEPVKDLLDKITKDIKSGLSFSKALSKFPHIFSNLYIALIKSGEASGKLSEILLKLADNLEKEREFKSKIKGALTYPAIILVAMLTVIFVMMTFVIPRLLNLYKEFNIDLPFTTKIIIFISSFFVKFWPILIGLTFAIIIIIKNYLSTYQGKFLFDNFLLKIPIIKNVIKISALVNSTRTLAILIGSGISILEALDIVIETTDNLVYKNSFQNIRKKVEKGLSLGTSFEEEEIYPPILVQMTNVGEQTGHLDDTLTRISRYFEMESELAVKTLTTLIEPAILVILGLGVGFLVTAVITPIYNLTSSFK